MMEALYEVRFVQIFDRRAAYWNPMWEWATRSEQRTASMTGLREPAAKGARVRGIRPTQTALQIPISIVHIQKASLILSKLGYDEPLESPVVATLGGVRLRNRNRVVHWRRD